jgi:L-seryl-tRNA(Ser) seleniumtransferase
MKERTTYGRIEFTLKFCNKGAWMSTQQELFRSLPKVDEVLLADELTKPDYKEVPSSLVLAAVRRALEEARENIAAGILTQAYSVDLAVRDALLIIDSEMTANLLPVVNATGIIVHTNLGRSILAETARDAVRSLNEGYSNLEYRVNVGQRGSRHEHIEALVCELTGAEAAMAVNNNASAVLLMLAALASGRETVVSRGQLVEIGGSFRIPDIMAASGTRMVEVGTTNKTHLQDYSRAMNEATGLLFKAHTSNYKVSGFVEEVGLAELVELGAAHGVPVVEDQGSGVLVDLHALNAELPHEPTIQESVAAGADLVSFSGDKLLGGPQAGIICGKRAAIATLKAHPLARAVRLDKMTLAALEATLRLYRDPERAVCAIPTLRMLAMTADVCRRHAEALAQGLETVIEQAGVEGRVELVEDVAFAGGGALPTAELSSYAVAVSLEGWSANELESALRTRTKVPIVCRIKDDQVLFAVRTLAATDFEIITTELEELL